MEVSYPLSLCHNYFPFSRLKMSNEPETVVTAGISGRFRLNCRKGRIDKGGGFLRRND